MMTLISKKKGIELCTVKLNAKMKKIKWKHRGSDPRAKNAEGLLAVNHLLNCPRKKLAEFLVLASDTDLAAIVSGVNKAFKKKDFSDQRTYQKFLDVIAELKGGANKTKKRNANKTKKKSSKNGHRTRKTANEMLAAIEELSVQQQKKLDEIQQNIIDLEAVKERLREIGDIIKELESR